METPPPEMGQVIPFVARVRESGDWTAAERARLEELADRLAADGIKVEAIFGATDEGDPWCVVTDENGDVLIHVARIGGRFVIHSAMDDVVAEGADLHAVLRERLEVEAADPQTAVVLPFAARQGQTFIALVIAAAFFYETAGVAETAQAAELPRFGIDPEPPPPAPDSETPAQERELAVQGAALRDPAVQAVATGVVAAATPEPAAPAPVAAVAPPSEPPPPPPPPAETSGEAAPEPAASAPPEPAPAILKGTDGDDEITGTAADERIEGGAGNDTLRGGGGHDSLFGGDGDDRIELSDGDEAEGGAGADTFVVLAPTGAGGPERLLGVVFDFDALAGDRLVTSRGHNIPINQPRPRDPEETGTTQISPPGEGQTDAGPPGVGSFGPAVVPPVTRVDVDIDGDGRVDGYVLVSFTSSAAAPLEAEGPIQIVGESLPFDPLG